MSSNDDSTRLLILGFVIASMRAISWTRSSIIFSPIDSAMVMLVRTSSVFRYFALRPEISFDSRCHAWPSTSKLGMLTDTLWRDGMLRVICFVFSSACYYYCYWYSSSCSITITQWVCLRTSGRGSGFFVIGMNSWNFRKSVSSSILIR